MHEQSPKNEQRCKSFDFGVNESVSGDNGIVRYTMTRVRDGQWKQFELILSPSTNPSADGQRTEMRGFSKCAGKPAMKK